MHLKRIKKLNQFILDDIATKTEVKGLNVDFIADLFHSFYIKYLRSKSDDEKILVQISSRILKKKYGTYYNYYVDFLVERRYISLELKHHSGKRCRVYSLNIQTVNSSCIVPYLNTNRKLLQFYNSDEYKLLQLKNSVYSKKLSKFIVGNLSHITIDLECSVSCLNSIFITDEDKQSRKYLKNLHSLKNINEGDIHVTFDRYGRVHTNFTVLKKEIRHNHLLISSERTHERDIVSSQAMFLLYLISREKNTGIDKIEIRDFQSDIYGAIFYENFVAADKTRKDVKVHFYKYIFGVKFQKFDDFTNRYPTISKFIYNYKTKNGYKDVSHQLQKMEGDFIFNNVCKKLMDQKIIFFTVHDSIVVKVSDSAILDKIFDDALVSLKIEINTNLKNNY